jgi:peroxiredoxin
MKSIMPVLIFILFPLCGICQIINDNEAVLVLRSLKIKEKTDTLKQHLDPGKYYIKFSEKVDTSADFDIQAIDVNSKEYEIKRMDSLQYIEIEKPTYIYLIVKLKNETLLNANVSIGLVYPLNPNLDLPSFIIEDTNGVEVTSESLIGKIIVVNFWALYCKPCIEEIPRLNKLTESYGSDEDIVFLALSPDSKEKVNKFLEKQDFNYRMFVGKKNIEPLESSIDLLAIPYHVIIDREGKLAFNLYGYTGGIDKILKERIEILK